MFGAGKRKSRPPVRFADYKVDGAHAWPDYTSDHASEHAFQRVPPVASSTPMEMLEDDNQLTDCHHLLQNDICPYCRAKYRIAARTQHDEDQVLYRRTTITRRKRRRYHPYRRRRDQQFAEQLDVTGVRAGLMEGESGGVDTKTVDDGRFGSDQSTMAGSRAVGRTTPTYIYPEEVRWVVRARFQDDALQLADGRVETQVYRAPGGRPAVVVRDRGEPSLGTRPPQAPPGNDRPPGARQVNHVNSKLAGMTVERLPSMGLKSRLMVETKILGLRQAEENRPRDAKNRPRDAEKNRPRDAEMADIEIGHMVCVAYEQCWYLGKEPQDGKVTKEPQDGKVTKEPQDGKVTKEPQNGKVTKEPRNGKVTKEPRNGKVTKEPRNGKGPQDGKVTKEPQDGKVTKEPQDGKVTKEPQDGKVTKEPQDGKVTKEPQDGKVTKEPQDGKVTKKPQNGKVTKEPQDGKVTKEPQNGKVTKEPQDGKVTKEPRNGKVTKEPQNGKVTKEPKDGEESMDLNLDLDLQIGDTVAVAYDPDDGWFIGEVKSVASTTANIRFLVAKDGIFRKDSSKAVPVHNKPTFLPEIL
uniref:Uncharacterized protein n=1 Tax=Branchiostoma floridae TaxID=7739 RepID=C3Z186_BRAFL|eukprot:XP_002597773.1 hypothetical protein BRAFLDRAFT_77324 [Branchiostoma floridae]